MNVRQHLEQQFLARHMTLNLLVERVLNTPHAYGQGLTYGEILAEMPLESTCGDDCKTAIRRARSFISVIQSAYEFDKPEHVEATLKALVDVCCCYIRG